MLNILKQLKEKKQADHNGEETLLKLLRGYRPERSHEVVHMSDMTKEGNSTFCPRQYALMDACDRRPKDRYQTAALTVTFAIGNAYSDLIRNKWLREHVVGHWQCGACESSWRRFCKAPKTACHHCGFYQWQYREVSFRHEESGVEGSTDMLWDVGTGKHLLYEIKSLNKDEFKVLKMAYAEHRIRTQGYLRLVEASNSPYKDRINTEVGRVLYVSKGFGAKQDEGSQISPFKEYRVNADREVADALLVKAIPLADYRKGGPMPAGICSNSLCPRAQHCHMAKECWSGQFPKGKSNGEY